MADDSKQRLREKALALGFDVVGFAPARLPPGAAEGLADFLADGRQGDMTWMADTQERRADPKALWPEARTIIVLGSNYAPAGDPLALVCHPERGNVSVYARNRDYHDVVKKRLKALGGWMAREFRCELKVFVDTAPVMEKPAAALSGLGWQGKHTNLVSRRFGSWLLLGEIFTTLDLPPDEPETDHCGSCAACRPACPTGALTDDGRIDARLCISYLTIEHKGHIPEGLRPSFGNRIYGCDDCLAACPWNKFATPTDEPEFLPRAELMAPELGDLVQLDDAGFRSVFSGSPIKRIGRDRFVRNVLIAIGNSGAPSLAAQAERLLGDPSPLVRAMAVWALRRLAPARAESLREAFLSREDDNDVRQEWIRPDAVSFSAP